MLRQNNASFFSFYELLLKMMVEFFAKTESASAKKSHKKQFLRTKAWLYFICFSALWYVLPCLFCNMGYRGLFCFVFSKLKIYIGPRRGKLHH